MQTNKKTSTYKDQAHKTEVEKLETTSAKIRYLYTKGYANGDIQRLLGLAHYQHVRNVLQQHLAREKKNKAQ